MKKLVCILVCLLLPIAAMAEAAQEVTVDFGDFTMTCMSNDELQQNEKADGAMIAALVPAAHKTESLTPNLNVLWFEEDLSPVIQMYGADAYAQAVYEAAIQQIEGAGLTISDPTFIGQELVESPENNCTILFIAYSMNVDYSSLGNDVQPTMYQEMAYMLTEGKGSYCFTLTGYDAATMTAMEETYLNSVVFHD